MANLPEVKNKGVVTKKPAELPYDHQPEGGFYTSSGKKAPRSTQVQMWANEKDINLELLDSGKDDKQAWATVRATNTKTGQFVDSRVILIYKQVQDKKMIELAENPFKRDAQGRTKEWMFKDPREPLLIGEGGEIMANLNPKGMIHLKKQLINYIYTAERTAETMAATRAEKKILNKEWEDETELTDEEILERMRKEGEEEEIKAPTEKTKEEPERKVLRTFNKKPKEETPKEKIKEDKEDEANGEKTEERKTEEQPTETPKANKETDVKKGVSGKRKSITRPKPHKKQEQNQELFPPTRPKEEYKGVSGKEIVSMIRTDLEKNKTLPEMKNISVMLKTLKNEKKISPHQFRVANEYNMEMNF